MKLKLLLAVAATLSVVAACGAGKAQLSADAAWVRLAPPGRATAGYLRIANRLDVPVQLTGATADAYASVSIHATEIVDGQARMMHAAPLAIAAHEVVEFKPGGLHLMLMQPQKQFVAGDTVTILLQFDGRDPVIVSATVRAAPP